jgi:hypothetical protein
MPLKHYWKHFIRNIMYSAFMMIGENPSVSDPICTVLPPQTRNISTSTQDIESSKFSSYMETIGTYHPFGDV